MANHMNSHNPIVTYHLSVLADRALSACFLRSVTVLKRVQPQDFQTYQILTTKGLKHINLDADQWIRLHHLNSLMSRMKVILILLRRRQW